MLPKGILFDLDDTILAFDAVANPTWQRLCATYARQYTLALPHFW
jgi:beta-phosphoglucomutase-like phosphatase (HAD superfamily)